MNIFVVIVLTAIILVLSLFFIPILGKITVNLLKSVDANAFVVGFIVLCVLLFFSYIVYSFVK